MSDLRDRADMLALAGDFEHAVPLYRELSAKGVDVLYDDTDQRPGGKFATADLIGLPWQVIVGPRGVAAGEVEIKNRKTGERETLPIADAKKRFGVAA